MFNLNKKNQEMKKYDYWRGFRACLVFIVVPLIAFYIIACNYIIAALG